MMHNESEGGELSCQDVTLLRLIPNRNHVVVRLVSNTTERESRVIVTNIALMSESIGGRRIPLILRDWGSLPIRSIGSIAGDANPLPTCEALRATESPRPGEPSLPAGGSGPGSLGPTRCHNTSHGARYPMTSTDILAIMHEPRPDHDPARGAPGRPAYLRGCRCVDCTRANAQDAANRRARLRAEREPVTAKDYWNRITPWNPDTANIHWSSYSPGSCEHCGNALVWTRARTMILCLDCNVFTLPEQVTQHVRSAVAKQRKSVPDRRANRIARNRLNSEREVILTGLGDVIHRLTIPADKYPASLVSKAASVRGELKGYIGDVSSAESLDELSVLVDEFLAIINERATAVFSWINEIDEARARPQQRYTPPPIAAIEPPAPAYQPEPIVIEWEPEPEPDPLCNRCGLPSCDCPYFTCDWSHLWGRIETAYYHLWLGNNPLHNNPAQMRVDLCDKCRAKFLRNPDATLQGYGFRYWQIERARVKK